MKITPRKNTQIKRFAMLMILGALGAAAATAVARADGTLTPYEERFGDSIEQALCEYIDNVGVTNESMTEAVKIIYSHTPANVDETDAVDIINYVVATYCPNHWRELVSFGEGYRHA